VERWAELAADPLKDDLEDEARWAHLALSRWLGAAEAAWGAQELANRGPRLEGAEQQELTVAQEIDEQTARARRDA
jgi:hypothetical protein